MANGVTEFPETVIDSQNSGKNISDHPNVPVQVNTAPFEISMSELPTPEIGGDDNDNAHDDLFDEPLEETTAETTTEAAEEVPIEVPTTTVSADPPESPVSQGVEPVSYKQEEITTSQSLPTGAPTPPQSSQAVSPKPEATEAVTSAKNTHERSDDISGPVAKRARTDDGSPSPSVSVVEVPEIDPARKMDKSRTKYCTAMIRQLKRSKDSPPFNHPVDPVKLKIPDYPKVITSPMDLSTVEKKMQKGQYATLDEFIADVNLVWSNCAKYNGPESPINKMALRLQETFEKQLRSMPPPDPVTETPVSKGKSTKKGVKRKNTAVNNGVPTIRRESIGFDGRPKREIHAPPPKSLPYNNAPLRRGKHAMQLKFCVLVVKELMKKIHEAYAFPFYHPVDPIALNIPEYYKIVKNPMDLGTIQAKLNNAEYETADDFEYDVRLMFKNCYKFNPAGTPVHNMGKRFEGVFNEKWAEKPLPRPNGYGSDSDGEDSDDDGPDKPALQMLTKQLEMMKNQINEMGKKKKHKKDKAKAGATGAQPEENKGPKKKGRKKKEEEPDQDESPMVPSYEQKTLLSTKMGYMSEHEMPIVVQILQQSDPNFDPEDDEVELDIDKIHPKTIRLLWNYCMEGLKPLFLKRKEKPKKNRAVLSEQEQQRQIEQLEAQLSRFNGEDPGAYMGAGIPGPEGNDSDSDSGASSTSEDSA